MVPPRVFLLSLFLCACAFKGEDSSYQSPCDKMEHEIKVKKKVDAEVKTLKDEVRGYEKSNDTASAASTQRLLAVLLETQKYLKEELDQNSQDCKPSFFESHFSY